MDGTLNLVGTVDGGSLSEVLFWFIFTPATSDIPWRMAITDDIATSLAKQLPPPTGAVETGPDGDWICCSNSWGDGGANDPNNHPHTLAIVEGNIWHAATFRASPTSAARTTRATATSLRSHAQAAVRTCRW